MDEEKRQTLLREDSVLLITGGAKGIAAQCAVRLAEIAKCKFILVGRSPVDNAEPEWAAGIEASEALQKNALAFFRAQGRKISPKELQREISSVLSSREINHTLAAIQSNGGRAIYISADVTDEKTLAEKVRQAVNELGQISGVIHAAGNLADKLIEKKTEKDYELVVDTKVKGLRSVIKCVDPQALEFVVLFSSVAGFFGNAGQADYAIANEILNKSALILHKTLPNCRVISINWGPWNAGMVSPELKKFFEMRGIPLIQSEDGVQALVDELTGEGRDMPVVVAGSSITSQSEIHINDANPMRIERQISLADNPFILDHRIGPNYVLPATCASSWLADACEASFPPWQFFRMKDFKVLKGITLNDIEQKYELKLEKIADQKNDELQIEAEVISHNANGRRIFHYSGRVILARNIPPAPLHSTSIIEKLKPSEFINGKRYYADGTLFHGPLLHGVQRAVRLNERQLITRVSLLEIPIEKQGQFPVGSVNPYVSDAIVQSLLIWSQETYAAPCLPSRVKEWVQYQTIPFNHEAWVILTVTSHNKFAVAGDILVMDDEGREFNHFSGLEGTVSQQLNRFIGRKAEQGVTAR